MQSRPQVVGGCIQEGEGGDGEGVDHGGGGRGECVCDVGVGGGGNHGVEVGGEIGDGSVHRPCEEGGDAVLQGGGEMCNGTCFTPDA